MVYIRLHSVAKCQYLFTSVKLCLVSNLQKIKYLVFGKGLVGRLSLFAGSLRSFGDNLWSFAGGLWSFACSLWWLEVVYCWPAVVCWWFVIVCACL